MPSKTEIIIFTKFFWLKYLLENKIYAPTLLELQDSFDGTEPSYIAAWRKFEKKVCFKIRVKTIW